MTTAAAAPNETTQTRPGQVLNADQLSFANTLAKLTGLDPNVAAAWVLQEGGSATGGKYNYLNIGNTDSGARSNASVWSVSPVAAATATAGWLKGTPNAVPGSPSTGSHYTGIFAAIPQGAEAQIRAIQASPFATSHEPNLGADWDEIQQSGGTGAGANTNATESVPSALSDPTGTLSSLNPLNGITGAVEAFLSALTNPQFWLRAVEVVGGGLLLIFGLASLTGLGPSKVPV